MAMAKWVGPDKNDFLFAYNPLKCAERKGRRFKALILISGDIYEFNIDFIRLLLNISSTIFVDVKGS